MSHRAKTKRLRRSNPTITPIATIPPVPTPPPPLGDGEEVLFPFALGEAGGVGFSLGRTGNGVGGGAKAAGSVGCEAGGGGGGDGLSDDGGGGGERVSEGGEGDGLGGEGVFDGGGGGGEVVVVGAGGEGEDSGGGGGEES